MHILMPVNAHSRYCGCTLSLQSLEPVATNIHNGQFHFNGLDIVVLGHLWAEWGTQAVYILVINI